MNGWPEEDSFWRMRLDPLTERRCVTPRSAREGETGDEAGGGSVGVWTSEMDFLTGGGVGVLEVTPP